MDPNNLKEFRRAHWEDASYEVSSQLAKWLGKRSHFKQKVDACTTDNSPWYKLDWFWASGAKNDKYTVERCVLTSSINQI